MPDRLCPFNLQPYPNSDDPMQDSQCALLAALEKSVKELRHAINNPLLLIIGHTQLLLAKEQALSAQTKAKLEKILQNAEKIRSIMENHEDLKGIFASKESLETIKT
jgi:nitrogen-specific signal transduction histidine kinase